MSVVDRVRQMMTRRCFLSALASGAAVPTRADTKSTPGGMGLHAVRLPGVDFIQRNSPTSQKYLIETMCGGVALLDYNNDGLLYIFFLKRGPPAHAPKSPARVLPGAPPSL